MVGNGIEQAQQSNLIEEKKLLLGRIEELEEKNRILLEENERLRELSETDLLTGLLNRRGWSNRTEEMMETLARNDIGKSVVLVRIDIDDFKGVNDQWGHDMGDKVLVMVADFMRDVFGRKNDILSRWGGDEFAIMALLDDEETVTNMCEQLRKGVEERDKGDKIPLGFRLSIGYCITDTNGLKNKGESDNRLVIEDLGKVADGFLYKAKRIGKNTVVGGRVD